MTPEIKRRIEQIQNENIPDGYKRMNVSDSCIPNEWTTISMSDLFTEVSEKNHPDSDVLTIIQGTGTVLREESGREIIYDTDSLSNYKFVKKGDFIIHLRSFEGGLEIANQNGIVSPAYIILRPKSNIATEYYYALFHSNRFISQTMAPAVEGVRDGRSVKYEVLKNQVVPFPPLPEQQKISKILYAQDKVIALKQNLLQEKKQQKKYLMQKLLSADGASFMLDGVKIDKSGWKNEKLGNILEFKNGVNSEKEKYGHGIKMISVMDILSEQPITFNSIKNSVEISEEDLKIYSVCNGDIIFQRSSENYEDVGKSNVYLDEKTATFSGFVIRGKKKHDYYPLCLNAILKTVSIRKQIMKKAAGAQHINIGQDSLASIIIKLPFLPEQQVIAKVLSAADKEIELLQKSIEQEKQKKKVLMQLLLSGIVRVKIYEC